MQTVSSHAGTVHMVDPRGQRIRQRVATSCGMNILAEAVEGGEPNCLFCKAAHRFGAKISAALKDGLVGVKEIAEQCEISEVAVTSAVAAMHGVEHLASKNVLLVTDRKAYGLT